MWLKVRSQVNHWDQIPSDRARFVQHGMSMIFEFHIPSVIEICVIEICMRWRTLTLAEPMHGRHSLKWSFSRGDAVQFPKPFCLSSTCPNLNAMNNHWMVHTKLLCAIDTRRCEYFPFAIVPLSHCLAGQWPSAAGHQCDSSLLSLRVFSLSPGPSCLGARIGAWRCRYQHTPVQSNVWSILMNDDQT